MYFTDMWGSCFFKFTSAYNFFFMLLSVWRRVCVIFFNIEFSGLQSFVPYVSNTATNLCVSTFEFHLHFLKNSAATRGVSPSD
jgi:hypothetical protein